jgi:hypothetical protein
MTQYEKELLIKDLSARIPYKVKASYYGTDEEIECTDIIEGIIIENNDVEIIIGQYGLSVEKVKPYLFPLSNMTEKHEEEWYDLYMNPLLERKAYMPRIENLALIAESKYSPTFWLIKNHFDYLELIPKGLAIDATNLNIY